MPASTTVRTRSIFEDFRMRSPSVIDHLSQDIALQLKLQG
jgi:hypothetical protein